MRIGCDVDGVCCDFGGQLALVAEERFGIETNPTRYDLGLSDEQLLMVYRYIVNNEQYLYAMEHYEVTRQVLWEWMEEGHEIFYITRRGGMFDQTLREYHEKQTMAWLLTKDFPYSKNVVFAQDKEKVCRELGITILIEDRLTDAVAWNGQELRVYLLDRPWNEGYYVRFGEYDYPWRIKTLRGVNLGQNH